MGDPNHWTIHWEPILQVSAMGPLFFCSMFQCGSGSTCWSPNFLLGNGWNTTRMVPNPNLWSWSMNSWKSNHGENPKFQLEKNKIIFIHDSWSIFQASHVFVVDRNMVLEKDGVDTPVVHVRDQTALEVHVSWWRMAGILEVSSYVEVQVKWGIFDGISHDESWNLTGFGNGAILYLGWVLLLFLLLVPGFAVVLETVLATNIVKRLNR